jgi:hypothetical protein
MMFKGVLGGMSGPAAAARAHGQWCQQQHSQAMAIDATATGNARQEQQEQQEQQELLQQ